MPSGTVVFALICHWDGLSTRMACGTRPKSDHGVRRARGGVDVRSCRNRRSGVSRVAVAMPSGTG